MVVEKRRAIRDEYPEDSPEAIETSSFWGERIERERWREGGEGGARFVQAQLSSFFLPSLSTPTTLSLWTQIKLDSGDSALYIYRPRMASFIAPRAAFIFLRRSIPSASASTSSSLSFRRFLSSSARLSTPATSKTDVRFDSFNLDKRIAQNIKHERCTDGESLREEESKG